MMATTWFPKKEPKMTVQELKELVARLAITQKKTEEKWAELSFFR
jgi:hypothetical protein